ncbi:MAG: hypothetical protein JWQ97_1872, partial [Phenylobacterium sp.]|nr:hypothetical protein [Phenylobacterium sp.]
MRPVAPHNAASAPREPVRLGTAMGAGAAALCSVALAIWAGSGGREVGPHATSPVRPTPPVAFAAPNPDTGQVRQAYAQLRDVYGEKGIRGVVDFSDACRRSVAAAPSQLDFCLAFALDAAALGAGSGDRFVKSWSERVVPEQLALIRSALPPGADAAGRLAAVQQLTRRLVVPAASPPALRNAIAHAPSTRHSRPVHARAKASNKEPVARLHHRRRGAHEAAAAKRHRVARTRSAAAEARL